MNENAIKNLSLTRARDRGLSRGSVASEGVGATGFFACALALALVAAVLVPLAVFGAGAWDAPLADLRSRDEAARAAAVKALASGGETALRELLGWMDSASRYTPAARVGVAMGTPVVRRLIALLKDPELGPRAGELLFQVSRPEVSAELPAVLACVKDAEVRDVCGRVLVRLMGPKGGKHRVVLEEALKTGEPMVKAYAAGALGQLGAKGKAAVPALVEALKDPEPTVRWGAAVALGKIGKKAAAAAPALEALSSDPDGQVRSLAKQALGKIRG